MNEVSHRLLLKKKLDVICIDCIKLIVSHPSQVSCTLEINYSQSVIKMKFFKSPEVNFKPQDKANSTVIYFQTPQSHSYSSCQTIVQLPDILFFPWNPAMESFTDTLNYFLFNMLRKKKESAVLKSHVFLFKKKGLHSSTRQIVLCKRSHAEIFKAPRIKKAVLVALSLSHRLKTLLLTLFFNSSLPGTVF